MTNPDELESAVERVRRALDTHRGYADIIATPADLRLILAERADLLAERRKLREAARRSLTEVEGALLGLTLLPNDFTALESLWPLSKRGSRAQAAYTTIKQRVEGITAYASDARQALSEEVR